MQKSQSSSDMNRKKNFLRQLNNTIDILTTTTYTANQKAYATRPHNNTSNFIKKSTKLGYVIKQRAKKVVPDSSGLVDFAIRLVNSVCNLPDGQVMFFEEFE